MTPRPLPKTYASLRFCRETLEPDDVTVIMATKPSLIYRKGDLGYRGESVRRFGLWLYSTRGLTMPDVQSHLEMIETILVDMPQVRDLVRLCDTTISVFWYGAKGSKLPDIEDHNLAQRVREMGGKFETDFHRDGDS